MSFANRDLKVGWSFGKDFPFEALESWSWNFWYSAACAVRKWEQNAKHVLVGDMLFVLLNTHLAVTAPLLFRMALNIYHFKVFEV